MSDPSRLSEADGPDAEIAFLLRAAKLESPPSLGKGRVLAGLGLVAGATTFASTGTAAAAAAGGAVAAKWIAIAVVGAALAVGGLEVSQAVAPRKVSGSVAAARALGAAASLSTPSKAPLHGGLTAPAPAPAPAPAWATVPAATPRRSDPPPTSPNSTLASAISAELAEIDRARRALTRGDPAAALASLDAHDRRFGQPYFAQEVTVLRVEALVGLADTDGARRVGEQLLRSEPPSPYAQRIRSLLRGSDTPANP